MSNSTTTLTFSHFHAGHGISYRVRVRIIDLGDGHATLDMMFGTSTTAYRGYIRPTYVTGICQYYTPSNGEWRTDDVSRDWQWHLFNSVAARLQSEGVF